MGRVMATPHSVKGTKGKNHLAIINSRQIDKSYKYKFSNTNTNKSTDTNTNVPQSAKGTKERII